MRVPLSLACIVFAAGCSSPAAEEIPQGPPALEAGFWSFSDCFGFDTAADTVGQLAVGNAPPGWEYDLSQGQPLATVVVQALRCNRIAVGDFEGGPVSIVFEAHSHFTPPNSCLYGEYNLFVVLNQILTESVPLAEALAEAGFSTRVVSVKIQTSNSTPVVHTWTWGSQGQTPSELEIRGLDPSVRETPPENIRFASWNANGLTIAQATWNYEVPEQVSEIALGTWGPEMLASQVRSDHANLASLYRGAEGSATVQTFGDLECEQPL